MNPNDAKRQYAVSGQHIPKTRTIGPEQSEGNQEFDFLPKIGKYQLVKKIGEGGFGSVWMAEQNEPVRRMVALKLIKGADPDREIIARFEAERQALAILGHPNIAKILDAGSTDSGSPFFVMELVDGIPLTEFCDDNHLSIEQRLNLFVLICKAVQHAHQKGIIHRDLKPSNVLVTRQDGETIPKVIDFGLAKALEHTTRLNDETMDTEFGKVIGTLQYMSPEQANLNTQDIDTRTDIYSLGVMLYELLTGSTPLAKKALLGSGLIEVLEMIRVREPPRPSNRLSNCGDEILGISNQRKISPSKLKQVLRGELDWIVMKALEKERSRRYETSVSLADDLHRFLRKESVKARPPSITYQAQKFVVRNLGSVVATLVISLLLLFAVGYYIKSAAEYNVQKSVIAELEDILLSIDSEKHRLAGNQFSSRESIQNKATFYATFLTKLGIYTQFNASPNESALNWYRDAIDRFEQLTDSDLEKHRITYATALENAAFCHQLKGEVVEANKLYEQALMQQELLFDLNNEESRRIALARTLLNAANVGEEELRLSKLILLLKDSSSLNSKDLLARAFYNRSVVSAGERHMQDARDAVQTITEVAAEMGDDVKQNAAKMYLHLGRAIANKEPKSALGSMETAIEILEEQLRKNPDNTSIQEKLAVAYYSLGSLLQTPLDDFAKSISKLDKAVEIYDSLRRKDVTIVKTEEYYLTRFYRAEAYIQQRAFAKAYEDFLTLFETSENKSAGEVYKNFKNLLAARMIRCQVELDIEKAIEELHQLGDLTNQAFAQKGYTLFILAEINGIIARDLTKDQAKWAKESLLILSKMKELNLLTLEFENNVKHGGSFRRVREEEGYAGFEATK